MDYKVCEIKKEEIPFLKYFLYLAIFVPEGVNPPNEDVIYLPELQIYISNFGEKEEDLGLVAKINNEIIGAVWSRIMNDYGHINDETPSLAISIKKEYRGQGIGTRLMKEIILLLKRKGFSQISLSVQKENFACKMYKKVGFEIIEEKEEEYIMVCNLE